jgi:hypothetical protein
MDAGFERLQRRGLMTDDEKLTDAGRAFREEIEVRTDELERPLLDALGDDLDESPESYLIPLTWLHAPVRGDAGTTHSHTDRTMWTPVSWHKMQRTGVRPRT